MMISYENVFVFEKWRRIGKMLQKISDFNENFFEKSGPLKVRIAST